MIGAMTGHDQAGADDVRPIHDLMMTTARPIIIHRVLTSELVLIALFSSMLVYF